MTQQDPMRLVLNDLTEEQMLAIQYVKSTGNDIWHYYDSLGVSRELYLAKTKLEESVMWAVKHLSAPSDREGDPDA